MGQAAGGEHTAVSLQSALGYRRLCSWPFEVGCSLLQAEQATSRKLGAAIQPLHVFTVQL